jgi:hypothetical protein
MRRTMMLETNMETLQSLDLGAAIPSTTDQEKAAGEN